MTKQQIVQYGDPGLRKVTSRVLKFDKSLRKLIEDMFETMYASDGVGLAAPQISVSKRVLVLDVDYPSKRYIDEQTKKEVPSYTPIVLINPVLIHKEGQIISKEGCLSFPNVVIDVIRFKKIIVRYQDLLGKERKLTAEDDLLCRCIQHEIDHLDGKLFVDKTADEVQMKKILEEAGFGNIISPASPIMIG
ncbi:MAG: peptide deformylase [Candidatus Melainabacteria bacterium RIFCSPLOWO2_02_FULL_35_15]|nr:MAG: peptide deformylase [Candidatus Melainabacteria bacterium RIFCSPLOWO2_12_FULL_35_11]OGI14008.1 MAG: peptide deformylase [Candidatus Melainabacteria bacterium RIFCSPLOWO2_02_FULL_35_15]